MSINFIINIFLCTASGFFLRLAFPEFNFYLLSWVILVPFILAVLREKNYSLAALYGFIFSFIFYFYTFGWCPVFYDYAPKSLVNLAWIGYALAQSFFTVLTVLIFKFLQRNLHFKNKIIDLIVGILNFSLLWIFFDWLRSLWIFGNTVGGLCYSQYLFLPFIQLAKYIGPYGLTFILVFYNTAIGFFFYDRLISKNKSVKKFWLVFFIILAFILGFWLKDSDLFRKEKTADLGGMVQPQDKYTQIIDYKKNIRPNFLRIAVYQPAIPQNQKLDYNYYQGLKTQYINAIKDFYLHHKPDYLILPETIVPEFLLNNKNFIFNLTDTLESSIIFGTPRWKDRSKGLEYYNSAVLIDRHGELLGYHDKKYLVPFGEYLPFRKYLYFLFENTGFLESEYTPGQTTFPMEVFGTAICFESTLPYQLRQQTKNGAKILLVVTNDAWFKQTSVLEQHLSFGVLRAVENNRWLIQAANTGISAVIDNHGKILKKTEIDQEAWLEAEVQTLTEKTPYTNFGELIIYLAIIYLLLVFYRTLSQIQ